MPWQDETSPFTGQGVDVGSANSQDLFVGYGTEFNNADRFYLDIDDRIYMLGNTDTKLISWLMGAATKPTDQVKFTHIESEDFSIRDFDAKLVRTMDSTSGVWTLQIAPQDWKAVETAAAGDTWTTTNENKPLIYATVRGTADGASTVDFSFIIEKGALYGREWRDIPAEDGNATNGVGEVQNHMVVATYDGSTITMGTSPHWTGTLANASATNCPTGFGAGDFLNTDWDGSASYDVTVHVTTPESELKGMPQGSGLPNETRKFSRSLYNFVQITKTPFSISNTLKATSMRGGNELAMRRYAKLVQHKDELERMLVFQGGGTEGTDWGLIPTGTENPLTRTKGLGVGCANTDWGGTSDDAGWIYTKNADIDSTYQLSQSSVTISDLHAFAEALFDDLVDNPSDTKVMFVGKPWLTFFANLAGQRDNGGFQFGDSSTTNSLGIPGVRTLMCPSGTLRLVPYKHFRGQYKNYGLVLDLKNVKYRPLRPTRS